MILNTPGSTKSIGKNFMKGGSKKQREFRKRFKGRRDLFTGDYNFL